MFKLGSKKDVNTEYKCTIRLLDDSEVLQCDFQHLCKGQYILDYVCNALNLLEKDYFGLRYVDSHKQRHWLDLTKPVIKQVKGMNPIVFCFRVKFYPQDPFRLKEEITRYQIFLQLRRDLLHGRLYCPPNDSALLAALIIQSELGDYDSEEHGDNYVSEFKLLLKQTPRLEEKIAEIHQQQLRGQVPAVAEANFLRKACLLDTYGVDPHPVKDHKGNQLYLGINYAGILTFQGSRKTHHFKWPDIQRINYEGKMFIIHLMFPEDVKAKKKHLMGFKCPTQSACHHLWKCAVEQCYFFTIPSSSEVPSVTTGGGFFSRGSRLRYSGRVEREVMDDMKNIRRDPPQFQRTLTRPPSFRQKTAASTTMEMPNSPSRQLNDGSPLRSSVGPVTSQQHNQQPPVSQDSGDGFAIDEPPKRLGTPLELLDSGESGEENGSSVLRPPNHDLHVNLTPSRNTPVADDEDSNIPDTPISELAFDPHPTPEYEPEHESQEPAFVTPQQSQRIVFVAWLVLPLLLILLLLVVLMEWDWAPLADMQRLPEVVLLRKQYYEPTRDAIGTWISAFFGPR
ncbi:FERM domain-containing protein 5 isoform X1 [Dermacentor silvarum]|uniref:FERM domain-containing protein 5 isoform X1 n=1 Tax=Dermacentor silvarum TaxID=543639 RepID=UPI001898BAB7|nr:FERM domain-containing protein 5 isoform X1 [Dermacentor silvarum]